MNILTYLARLVISKVEDRPSLEIYKERAMRDAEMDAKIEGSNGFFILGFFTWILGIITAFIYTPIPKMYRLVDKPELYIRVYQECYIEVKRKQNIKSSCIGTLISFGIFFGISLMGYFSYYLY
jgi:hypothetical protein